MKKYLLFSALCITLLIFSLNLTAFKSAESNYEYILVEIYEIPSYKDKGVYIHYADGRTEVVPFKEFKAEHHDDNGAIILKTINELGKKGYKISNMTSGLAQSGMITKVFLSKRK